MPKTIRSPPTLIFHHSLSGSPRQNRVKSAIPGIFLFFLENMTTYELILNVVALNQIPGSNLSNLANVFGGWLGRGFVVIPPVGKYSSRIIL